MANFASTPATSRDGVMMTPPIPYYFVVVVVVVEKRREYECVSELLSSFPIQSATDEI
jgi:hypothetical protein